MQRKSFSIGIVALAAVCGFARADKGRTSFLHSGELNRQLVGRSKQCDFEFTLWDASEGGERIGRTLIYDGWEANKARVPVDDGYFEVVLDFGVEIYDDEPVYVESRCACGRSAKWATVSRVAVTEDLLFEDDRLEGLEDRIERVTPLQPSRPTRIAEPDGPGGESIEGFNNTLEAADGDPSPAVIVDAEGNTSMVGDLTVGGAIKIDGDNNPLEIHVNGIRALRFEYSDAQSEAPNIIGGSPFNSVVLHKAGAVIAGGGSETGYNQVSEDWGTVSGGRSNHAFGMFGTVSGGSGNTATGEGSTVSGGENGDALGIHSTVGGGLANAANGDDSTVSGEATNTAGALGSSIGGGQQNSAGGEYASVPGGFANSAAGDFSFAGGRRAKANHIGSFVWGDSTPADFASTANNQFRVRASGGASFSHNVGIGTTTPGILLTFANALGNKISLWGQDGDQEHYGFGIQAGTLQMYGPNGSKIAFGHGRSEAFTERMQIAANGNVGIGTAPEYPLDVSRTTSTEDWAAHFGNGDSNVFLAHGVGFGMHINTGGTNSTERYALLVRNAPRLHFYVRDDGNVGVGTPEPATRLHVIDGSDSALSGGGFLTFGNTNGSNISIDNNEIMARNNGNSATLNLNADGGLVQVGSGGISTTGNISFGSASGFTHFGPFTAEKHNTAGTDLRLIIPSAKAFCSLSLMDVEDTDSVGERAQCNVFIASDGWWYVQAYLHQNDDAGVFCQARCLRWD